MLDRFRPFLGPFLDSDLSAAIDRPLFAFATILR